MANHLFWHVISPPFTNFHCTTKYRNATFTTPALVNEMKDILRYIADLHDITIEKMEVMSDHVHMLISFKPKYSATNIIKARKEVVERYIANQND